MSTEGQTADAHGIGKTWYESTARGGPPLWFWPGARPDLSNYLLYVPVRIPCHLRSFTLIVSRRAASLDTPHPHNPPPPSLAGLPFKSLAHHNPARRFCLSHPSCRLIVPRCAPQQTGVDHLTCCGIRYASDTYAVTPFLLHTRLLASASSQLTASPRPIHRYLANLLAKSGDIDSLRTPVRQAPDRFLLWHLLSWT